MCSMSVDPLLTVRQEIQPNATLLKRVFFVEKGQKRQKKGEKAAYFKPLKPQ